MTPPDTSREAVLDLIDKVEPDYSYWKERGQAWALLRDAVRALLDERETLTAERDHFRELAIRALDLARGDHD